MPVASTFLDNPQYAFQSKASEPREACEDRDIPSRGNAILWHKERLSRCSSWQDPRGWQHPFGEHHVSWWCYQAVLQGQRPGRFSAFVGYIELDVVCGMIPWLISCKSNHIISYESVKCMISQNHKQKYLWSMGQSLFLQFYWMGCF